MKIRTATVVVVLAFLTSTVFAVGHIGPPTAGLNKGQWIAGFNYSYSSQDLDRIKVKWNEVGEEDGSPYTDSGVYKLKNKDTNIQRYYVGIGYGLSDWWEVFGQIGIADVKGKFKEVGDDEDWYGVNLDNDLAWGWGTKITFAKQGKIDWGAAFLMNWLDTSQSDRYTYEDDGYSESWKETVDIEAYDLLFTVGPTIDMGGWKLYGGPFYYFLSGDYNYKENGTWEVVEDGSGSWICKDSGDADMDSFGGYIGSQLELAKNCNATIEFSFTGDGWGLGTGITFKF